MAPPAPGPSMWMPPSWNPWKAWIMQLARVFATFDQVPQQEGWGTAPASLPATS